MQEKDSFFSCCTADNTVSRDLNMTSGSGQRKSLRPEIRTKRRQQSYEQRGELQDQPALERLGAESALIEERVSERLSREFMMIQQEKEKEYWQRLQKEREVHEQKQEALRQEIIRQDLELERKNQLLMAQR